MKKLLVVFFALSLVLAFTMPATATDLAVSGSFYVGGVFDDNANLRDNVGPANAWYFQRLRTNAVFVVNPALKLVTRFDAMEGYWNGPNGPTEYQNLGTRDDDNIDFDRAYVEAKTAYGVLSVGYMSDGAWGTWFADTEIDSSRIKFQTMVGGYILGAIYTKVGEFDRNSRYSDLDNDKYLAYVIKPFKGGMAGLLWVYLDYAANTDFFGNGNGFRTTFHLLEPFVKAKIGNLYIEAEADYCYGAARDWNAASGVQDLDKNSLSFYVNGKYNIGSAYVGGQIAFVQGDDDPNDNEDNTGATGSDYDPCLILWNSDLFMWNGGQGLGGVTGDTMTNAWLYQIYAGVSPMAKLDLLASYSIATVDAQGANVSDEIGSELDFTATYKIMDNLDYMVGAGFFFAGDFYKGTNAAAVIDDDYILINKLTLSF